MLAIIGGSGFYQLDEMSQVDIDLVTTKYASKPVEVLSGAFHGRRVLFLPRHGRSHSIAPHRIDYRANIDALTARGVTKILSICCVGGITDAYPPETFSMPDQIIDYTWGRASSFEDDFNLTSHVDFAKPFSSEIQQDVLQAANDIGVKLRTGGVYGCTQGPRLETAAEIRRMARDGCDMVGMTMMPESVLARERGMEYCAICMVANWAAGVQQSTGDMQEMKRVVTHLAGSMQNLVGQCVAMIKI